MSHEPLPGGRAGAFATRLAVARHLLVVVAPLGVVIGALIAAYDWLVNEILWSHVLGAPEWVRYAAPVAGMGLAGLLLHAFRVRTPAMADDVVRAYHDPAVDIAAPEAGAKFAASVATMGLGASAGMEGASKWVGATAGQFVQRRLNAIRARFVAGDERTTLLAGGAAGIAAIFRAPLSGAVMGVESPYKSDLAHSALVPALVASATSFATFAQLRTSSPYFPVTFPNSIDATEILVAVPLGISAGLLSQAFLATLARTRDAFTRALPAVWARALAGGVVLAAVAWVAALVVGAPVTLHSGLPVANDLLAGRYALAACAAILVLKLAATSVTFGSGGVGGLFVPTATIGAALGACWDAACPSSRPGVYTLLGIAAFAGASYQSLLFSAVFIAEATGNVSLVVPALVASAFAFLAAAGVSNSKSQRATRSSDDAVATMRTSSLMTRDVVTVSPTQTLDDVTHAVFLRRPFKSVPVTGPDGVLAGVVAVRHLREVPREAFATRRVADVMDAAPPSVAPDASVADAERVLASCGYDEIPVTDPATGRVVGVIAATDVLRVRDAHRA